MQSPHARNGCVGEARRGSVATTIAHPLRARNTAHRTLVDERHNPRNELPRAHRQSKRQRNQNRHQHTRPKVGTSRSRTNKAAAIAPGIAKSDDTRNTTTPAVTGISGTLLPFLPTVTRLARTEPRPPPSNTCHYTPHGQATHTKEKPRSQQALTDYGAEAHKRPSSRLQPFVRSPYITCDIRERPGRRSINITIARLPPCAQHTGNEIRATLTDSTHSRSQRGQGHTVTKRHGYDASAITP